MQRSPVIAVNYTLLRILSHRGWDLQRSLYMSTDYTPNTSALEISHFMRYINLRLTFTSYWQ